MKILLYSQHKNTPLKTNAHQVEITIPARDMALDYNALASEKLEWVNFGEDKQSFSSNLVNHAILWLIKSK